MLQHEKASIEMFEYLVKDNDLEKEMEDWKLDLTKDLVFIKEMIDPEKEITTVSHAQGTYVKSISINIATAANI